ncbi:uncharacterized protein DUF262 [Arthrobacter sp. AG1021]|uniref:GmrSD restriction endonuclease domain-containing protein n=1 Tax=Arthrobacter sp. AG1021 TaxID=2183908 RepID=UPI000F2C28E6|nr:DUF262 domain-containing protein [Arthrobacter sp. AG1021]RKS22366.1 uncharacterized protein DUF262 [Arthrobacter sp. AG1021]
MGTGSEAQNRKVQDWLARVDSGQLRLPSFQRGVAWDSNRVVSLLDTIIDDLPLGIALVLNVGDKEQFISRSLESAPETSEQVTEHLLDGQQRLTALYRALRDNDPQITYFVHFPVLDQNPGNDDHDVAVRKVARWTNASGTKFPMWVDSPSECLSRGMVPVRLLDPTFDRLDDWLSEATKVLEPGADIVELAEFKAAFMRASEYRSRAKSLISEKRETLKHFNLPYLSLPAQTSKSTALDVFVKMNTNAKPLKAHDIFVAELESITGRRLKEMEDELERRHPYLKKYFNMESAVLQTSALLQNKIPGQRGFFEMNHEVFVENWDVMSRGLVRSIQLVKSLRILDGERLPTAIPIPVVAALIANEPENGDERAAVDKLMRQYLWRSFFTSRYDSAAATRAFVDYRALKDVMDEVSSSSAVPILDDEWYSLPSRKDLKSAGWPKAKRSLSRAILAASTYFGARDFADDTKLNDENISSREYHHIFPDKLLKDARIESMLALNCALITWKTNRTIARSAPIKYLEERAQRAPNEQDIERRLRTHLVPYQALKDAGPYEFGSSEELFAAVRHDFDRFLECRAVAIENFMRAVCSGDEPSLSDII